MKSKKPKTTHRGPTRRVQPAPRTPSVPENLHERIAVRAYEIFEQRIRQGPLDDWLQAERETLGMQETSSPDRPHRGGYAAPEQE